MEQADQIPFDNESINSDHTESSCRSRIGSIKDKQVSPEETFENAAKKRKSQIRHCIGYLIIFLLAAAAVALPVIMILMKRPSVYRVTYQSTIKPVTMSPRTRTTTTAITTTPRPIDHCERKFVALTKNMDSYLSAIAVADLNNDNKLDIAFVCETKLSVYIIFNQGNNKFANWIEYPIPDKSYSLTIADLNADNTPDIIVGPQSRSYPLFALLNDGHGNFNQTIDISTNGYGSIHSIIAIDLNNDQRIDLIFTIADRNLIGIVFNRGHLIFDPIQTYSVGQLPMSIYADDLNGDQKLDLIVTNTHTHTMDFLFNQGNEIFSSGMNLSVDYGPVFVRTSDLNNDNRSDIILVNFFSNNIVIYLNNGQGNFSRYFNISTNANPLSIALNDYNNDGLIDIIAPNYHSNSIDVYFNDGNGMFSTTTSYIVYPVPRDVIVADINHDEKMDIVLGNGYYLGVVLSRCD